MSDFDDTVSHTEEYVTENSNVASDAEEEKLETTHEAEVSSAPAREIDPLAVFLKGVPSNLLDKQLTWEIERLSGEIVESVEIFNNSKGGVSCATARFADEESCSRAREELASTCILGSDVVADQAYVRRDKPEKKEKKKEKKEKTEKKKQEKKQEKKSPKITYGRATEPSYDVIPPPNPDAKTLFVTRLDPSFTSEQIREVFVHYGNVMDAEVICDRNGKSKSFAFVTFKNQKDAFMALKKLSTTTVNGNIVVVEWARPKGLSAGFAPQVGRSHGPAPGPPRDSFHRGNRYMEPRFQPAPQPYYAPRPEYQPAPSSSYYSSQSASRYGNYEPASSMDYRGEFGNYDDRRERERDYRPPSSDYDSRYSSPKPYGSGGYNSYY